ncbi:MAG: pilus assembly protein PilM [Candidatus Riflebacteria bacterium]|nr:pilus assembly protein PilM [Candidatus Riflebacteria bacterium]
MAKPKFEPLVSVDIGSFSLKFIFIQPDEEGKPVVKALSHIRIPSFAHMLTEEERSGMSKEDVEKDTTAKVNKFLTKYLTELLYDNQILTKKGITLAGGRTATIRYIEIPPSPNKELLSANIKAEASKQMPFSIENAVLGFTVLGETVRDEKAVQQVVVAALQKDFLKISTENLKGGGLLNEGIVILPQTLEILLGKKLSPPAGKELKIGIIHCGHKTTSIMVYRNGALNFFRDIPLAGEHITEAIFAGGELEGKKIEIADLEEAIELKHKIGVLPPDEMKKLSGKERFAAQQIFNIVEKILQHIQLSISFYASQFGESGLDRIYLSGGSAAMKNFRDFIGESMDIPAELINPFADLDHQKVNFPPERMTEEGPGIAPSVGMAMYNGDARFINFIDIVQPNRGSQGVDVTKVTQKFSASGSSKLKINLDLTFLTQLDERKLKILLGLVGVLLVLIVSFPVIKIRKDVAETIKEQQAASNQLQDLNNAQTEVQKILQEKERLGQENHFIDIINAQGFPFSAVLLELASSTPDFIYLTHLEFFPEKEGKGFRLSGNTENSDKIFEYLNILGKCSLIKSPVMTSSQEQKIDDNRYYISFEISGKVEIPQKKEKTGEEQQ